ncbi:aspartate aminotransferase family protein [Streptomyces kanamyceticus]|uniref:Aspartate aminotransferase family protein n=1 Tax=Streptomyces kanamyceticus TaxID=1967 RepID=A0A5J6GQX0_STRKN|nr:aspartate aminotransferase family protein [Streptomyces kanamyceticus]QEU96541.1 aspartate aminotransferase family protein [Streptomyces kanamyceticus]
MRTYRQVLAEAKAAHNHPTYAKMAFVMGCGVQGEGSGSAVLDDAGQSFLAMFDQYGNQSLGYSHPRIIAALRDQLDSGVLNSSKIMFEEVQIRLTERLAEVTDQELPFAYLANGGGETIDNALKLARAATGRPRFISALGCFHGKTFATLGAAARPEHQASLGPLMAEFEQVPFGDLDALAAALDDSVAAVLLEPVQAEAGVVPPPPDYLREVRRLCTEAGALLVLDEMQTAFGRCGTFFAYQRYGITPDLLCVGKAFGGGMLALSAVLGTEAVWEVLRELPSTFGSSLGGNPLACRAGLETIAIASDEEFLADVRTKGERIAARLSAAAERYPEVIAEHRGVGMMHGLELRDEALTGLVLGRLIEEGVTSTYSLYNPRVLRVQPPLVISDADLERGLSVLEGVLAEADAARGRVRPTAAVSPLTRTVPLAGSADAVLRLLRERPRLLDPFALDNQADRQESAADFSGRIGQDEVVWSDRIERRDDGVALRADPCWLWQDLARTAVVRPAPGGGCTVEVEIAWDTGSGGYEEMLGGRIALFAEERLTHLLTRLEKELENE